MGKALPVLPHAFDDPLFVTGEKQDSNDQHQMINSAFADFERALPIYNFDVIEF